MIIIRFRPHRPKRLKVRIRFFFYVYEYVVIIFQAKLHYSFLFFLYIQSYKLATCCAIRRIRFNSRNAFVRKYFVCIISMLVCWLFLKFAFLFQDHYVCDWRTAVDARFRLRISRSGESVEPNFNSLLELWFCFYRKSIEESCVVSKILSRINATTGEVQQKKPRSKTIETNQWVADFLM